MNACNELEFPGKTYQLNSRPSGITALMSFLICLTLPLWLAQPVISFFTGSLLSLREQTVSVNDLLRKHVQDKPRASLQGNVREETKEWAENSIWMEQVMLLLEAKEANPLKEMMRGPNRVWPHRQFACRADWEMQLCTGEGQWDGRAAFQTPLFTHLLDAILFVQKVCWGNGQTKPLAITGSVNRTSMED